MKPLAALLGAVAILVVLAACKTSRKGDESAPYKVVSRDGKFEVRDYPALTVVETPMGNDTGSSFQRLFRYISGSNANAQKIAMTTPVFMAGTPLQRSMSFVMPADRKSPPAPNDSSVSVATIPAGRFAVFGFSGSRSEQAEADALSRLREWLIAQKFASSAEPIFGYFDPPWTPPLMRRNEVMLRLDAQASTN